MEEGKQNQIEPPQSWVRKERKKLILITVIGVIVIIAIFFAIFILPMLGHDGSMKVQSDSMQHNESGGKTGIIDKGDTIFYDKIDNRNDVKTYFQGKRQDYKKYGEYGDVIVYNKNGFSGSTPVIHRALIWIEYNASGNSFDIPELKHHKVGIDGDWYILGSPSDERWYNLRGTLVLRKIGYDEEDVTINLNNIILNYNNPDIEPHSGSITLGDHNGANCDQNMLRDEHGGVVRPVTPEWVVGKVTHLIDK
jgi:signal peptidase